MHKLTTKIRLRGYCTIIKKYINHANHDDVFLFTFAKKTKKHDIIYSLLIRYLSGVGVLGV